jgi:hypothetical protein
VRLTSDGGLILVREINKRLGLGELIEQQLADSRRGFVPAQGTVVTHLMRGP